jgi:hydroxymethylpyrimidine/phosphomethylpyrimidine kinase
MRRLTSALTIAGSDSCGGAGVQADLRTFLALGIHGASVLTVITAQNTRGVQEIFPLPAEIIRQQLRAVLSDLRVEWAKTGMLYSREIIETVLAERGQLKLVVDPVMRAASGTQLLQPDALPSLLKLISQAEIVTPNLPEAEVLAGMRIRNQRDLERAAEKIAELGVDAVVIKGGHLPGEHAIDFLYHKGRGERIKRRKIRVSVHGAGCSFSAAVTALLAQGWKLDEAVKLAGDFVHQNILHAVRVGRGLAIPSLHSLEKAVAVEEVYRAARRFVESPFAERLIPEVGINIVMALRGARNPSQVVGLSGRIVRVGGKPVITGFPVLGGSQHMANAVLTIMKYDENLRAGMNIRYWEGVEKACKRLGLKVSEFSRGEEPKKVKTMRWGVEEAIKRAGFVPQVIFDRGAPGKEAMVRIFGRTPDEVVEIACSLGREIPSRIQDS